MHQGTKSRGVGHRQGSGRYKDCVLASPSVEGMASARGDVGVKRGVQNLYKLWNRLSSGSYFPPPVRRVDIPKANGGTRLIEHAECINRRLADPGVGSKGGNRDRRTRAQLLRFGMKAAPGGI